MSSLLFAAGCGEDEAPEASTDTGAAAEAVADKAQDAVKVVEGWTVDRTSKADMEAFFKSDSQSSGGSDKALSQLGVAKTGSGVSWESMEGSNGNYTYDQLTFGSGSDRLQANEMLLSGVHMDGANASFDKMVLLNATVESDDGEASFDRLMVSDPHPEVAAAIFSSLSQFNSMDDMNLNVDLDDGEMPFGAMMMEGVKMDSDDGSGSIDVLGWGINDTDGKGAFLVENLTFEGVGDTGEPMEMSLGNASGKNINLAILQSLNGELETGEDSFGEMTGSLFVGDLAFTSPKASMTMDALQYDSSKTGSVTTQRLEMKPLTVTIDEVPPNPEVAQAFEALQSMGYDELQFTANMTASLDESTDTMIIKDSVLSMRDGFDFSVDGKMSDFGEGEDDPLIHNMTLALTDKNIVERGFELAAEMQGGNAALMRMQTKGALGMAPAMVPPEQKEIVTMMIGPFGDFLDGGGTLVLNLNPSSPMRASDMEAMGEDPAMLEKLGMTLSFRE